MMSNRSGLGTHVKIRMRTKNNADGKRDSNAALTPAFQHSLNHDCMLHRVEMPFESAVLYLRDLKRKRLVVLCLTGDVAGAYGSRPALVDGDVMTQNVVL